MPKLTGTQVQYVSNEPVGIDGGAGFDKTVVLATEFADHLVVDANGVYGAGLTVSYTTIESLEVDAMEGDDTIDVVSTAFGLGTRVIGNLGSDVINVTGDVFGDVVSKTTFPLVPEPAHLLDALNGPLAVEGGETGADRSLWIALLLPPEKNAALFNIAPQNPESGQIDILDVFDDSRVVGGTGTFASTGLTGFGTAAQLIFPIPTAFGESSTLLGGISFGAIRLVAGVWITDPARTTLEVVNVLLGSGADALTVTGSIVPAPDRSTGVVAFHGGVTVLHGGGGDDTITVTGGGGPDSPLVVYGDTSQDGRWYAGSAASPSFDVFGSKPFVGVVGNSDTFRLPLANAFAAAGNDTIDASLSGDPAWSVGVDGVRWPRQRHDQGQPRGRLPRGRLRAPTRSSVGTGSTRSTATRASTSTCSAGRSRSRRSTRARSRTPTVSSRAPTRCSATAATTSSSEITEASTSTCRSRLSGRTATRDCPGRRRRSRRPC